MTTMMTSPQRGGLTPWPFSKRRRGTRPSLGSPHASTAPVQPREERVGHPGPGDWCEPRRPTKGIGSVFGAQGTHPEKRQPETPVRKLAHGVGPYRHSCVADTGTPSDRRAHPIVWLESRPALRSNRAGTLGMENDSICLTVARSRAQMRTRATLRERGRRTAALTNDPGSALVAMGSRQDSRRCVAAA